MLFLNGITMTKLEIIIERLHEPMTLWLLAIAVVFVIFQVIVEKKAKKKERRREYEQ